MAITSEQLDEFLKRPEDYHLEFKNAAKFSDDELFDYCAALANEKGGYLVFGVENKTRTVAGTFIFQGTLFQYSNRILNAIGVRVDVEEIKHPHGRVVVFSVPSRPVGRPVQSRGKYTYPMRAGESLTEMDQESLKKIFAEVEPDFSAQIIEGVTVDDLDDRAVAEFKKRRAQRTNSPTLADASINQVLGDVGLIRGGTCTRACLILLGKREKIMEYLPQSEIIFEWRNDPKQTHHDFRAEWKMPYFAVYDEIWNTINARNSRFPFQEGFIQREVWGFDEKACREAVNNAIAHRDYSIVGQSVFILASPHAFSVASPGGFPADITAVNIRFALPFARNRLIAEAFQFTGLVERSGQGIDDIFTASISQGKGLPDFEGTSGYTVRINIPAKVKDPEFIKFLEKVANEKQVTFTSDELYELELMREAKSAVHVKNRDKFLQLGIIEKIGRTRDSRYILSHSYYIFQERPGVYTRVKGLARDHKKQIILDHIRREKKGMTSDFLDAFPELTQQDISNLLQELKKDGVIAFHGSKRTGHWVVSE